MRNAKNYLHRDPVGAALLDLRNTLEEKGEQAQAVPLPTFRRHWWSKPEPLSRSVGYLEGVKDTLFAVRQHIEDALDKRGDQIRRKPRR